MICETLLWYDRFGCGVYFPKSDKKGLDFVSSAQTRQFSAVKCETMLIFLHKVSMQKLTSYPSSLNDIWNLAMVLLAWLWCIISQKWQNRNGFCQRRPNAPILPIFGGWVLKIVNIFHQSFNAKTHRLSFLFVMICETWHWYYRFGCGM